MFDYQGEAEVIRGDVEQGLKELKGLRGQDKTYIEFAGDYKWISQLQISAKAEYHAWTILSKMIRTALAA